MPTISPRNSQEAPVNESVIRFNFLVLFQIHPKRLKKIRVVWKMMKNMSRRCQIIFDRVSVKIEKKA
jgi:hypothetical protein